MMLVRGKGKTLCGIYRFSFFHNLWKNRWKIKKRLVTADFYAVEKNRVFSTFSPKSNGHSIFPLHIFAPVIFMRFDFCATAFRFHNFLHIFLFSTSHLFKNFHSPPVRKLFSTNRKSFPYTFPLEKPRKTKCENPCGY